MTDKLLRKDTANLKEFIFPFPAFALMDNWDFGQYFKQTANAKQHILQTTQATPQTKVCKRAVSAILVYII